MPGYLGEDKETWKKYDSCELMRKYTGPKLPMLVDQVRRTKCPLLIGTCIHPLTHACLHVRAQGSADNFLSELMPKNLEAAAAEAGYPLTLRMHEGYDHSYFFMSTFIDDHIAFHAAELSK